MLMWIFTPHRVNGIEESYSSSQPESTHRHRHRRSHSDNSDWPAVEDYGLLYQPPELSHGFERRQSYSGCPAAMAADSRRTSFNKPPGYYDDLRYVDERMYGANERRRNSFPAAKVRFYYRNLSLTVMRLESSDSWFLAMSCSHELMPLL